MNTPVQTLVKNLQYGRKTYVWTAGDTVNGFAVVPVVFPYAFQDTNYTIVWGVNDTDLVIDLDFFVGDVHDKTNVGTNLIVRSFGPGSGTVGDVLILSYIAIHD